MPFQKINSHFSVFKEKLCQSPFLKLFSFIPLIPKKFISLIFVFLNVWILKKGEGVFRLSIGYIKNQKRTITYKKE